MLKYVSYIAIALASALLTALMSGGGHFIGPSKSPSLPTFEFSYSDFVSFLLTVLAVIITALALAVGLVAFRTINEIKREARQIAQEHSKSEVERSLEGVPERVTETVEQEVKDRLPNVIDKAVEEAGKAGRLDEALQKAIIQMSVGGGSANTELQPNFDAQSGGRKSDED